MNPCPVMLKDALYQTVHQHPTLSVEAIAEQLGVSTSYLYRSVTPDQDMSGPDASGVRFPAKQIVPLIKITGNLTVLDTMERQCNRVAVPVPQTSQLSISDLQTGAIKAASEFGDVMREIQKSMQDNHISREERERIKNECWQAMQALAELAIRCDRDGQ